MKHNTFSRKWYFCKFRCPHLPNNILSFEPAGSSIVVFDLICFVCELFMHKIRLLMVICICFWYVRAHRYITVFEKCKLSWIFYWFYFNFHLKFGHFSWTYEFHPFSYRMMFLVLNYYSVTYDVLLLNKRMLRSFISSFLLQTSYVGYKFRFWCFNYYYRLETCIILRSRYLYRNCMHACSSRMKAS